MKREVVREGVAWRLGAGVDVSVVVFCRVVVGACSGAGVGGMSAIVAVGV